MPRTEGCVYGLAQSRWVVPKKFSCRTVTAAKPFSHRGRAVTAVERDVVRDERGALLSCVGWPVSFEILMFKHGVLVERGRCFLSFVLSCDVDSLEG